MTQRWCWIVLLAGLALATTLSRPAFGQDNAAGGAAATAPAGEELKTAPPATLGSKLGEFWEGFKKKWVVGGLTMWPIGFAGLVGIVFAVDRLVAVRRARVVPHGLADQANRLWQDGKFSEAVALCRRSNSTLGRVLAFLVEHRTSTYEQLNQAAEDIAARDFETHARRTYPLAAVGTIAPLLGLLGTVSGLLGAFASIGAVGTMDDPSVLAGNIGEALITTFAGLWVAIPALAVYHVIRGRTGFFASVLGEEVSTVMHTWFLKKEAVHAGQA